MGVLVDVMGVDCRRGTDSTRLVEVERCNRSGLGVGVDECSFWRNAVAAKHSTEHGSNHNSIDMIDKHWTGPTDGLHPSTLIFLLAGGE